MALPYDKPRFQTLQYLGVNFASTTTRVVPIPPNVSGVRVALIQAWATTAFVGTSTPAAIEVGDGTTAALFANLPFGTAGTPTPVNSGVFAYDYYSGLVGQNPNTLISSPPISFAYAGPLGLAMANSYTGTGQLVTTFLAGTGGTPAGVADVYINLEYFYSG